MANNQNQSDKQGTRSTSGSGENRGFGSMDEDKQREIAAEGGRAAHRSGNAHEFDSEEAREAGKKGGQTSSGNRESGNPSDRSSSGSGDKAGQAGRSGSGDDSEE